MEKPIKTLIGKNERGGREKRGESVVELQRRKSYKGIQPRECACSRSKEAIKLTIKLRTETQGFSSTILLQIHHSRIIITGFTFPFILNHGLCKNHWNRDINLN